MIKFFDYLYYRTCEFYNKREGGSDFKFMAVLVTSTIQGFNLLSILFIIGLIAHEKIEINKFYYVILGVILIIINVIRYNKYDYDILKGRWGNEEERIKHKKKNLLIAYIIISTVLCLGLAINLGSKKW